MHVTQLFGTEVDFFEKKNQIENHCTFVVYVFTMWKNSLGMTCQCFLNFTGIWPTKVETAAHEHINLDH